MRGNPVASVGVQRCNDHRADRRHPDGCLCCGCPGDGADFPLPRTASGRCRRRTTPAPATASSPDHHANVARLQLAWTFSAATRGHEAAPLVVGGTMYVVTPYPEPALRARPHQAGRAAKWEYEPEAAPAAQGVACCDVGEPRRGVRRRRDLLQHARQPHGGAWTPRPARAVADQARRHQHRRDDDDGAAGGEGKGARRQQRRRVRRARLAHRARRRSGRDRLARLQHRPRRRRAHRPGLQAVLRAGPRARTSA